MKIAIYAEYFIDWGGGIDFLRIILKGLNKVSKKYNLELVVFIPIKTNSTFTGLKLGIKKIINTVLRKKKYHIANHQFNLEHVKNVLSNEANLTFVTFNHSESNFIDELKHHQIDVIIPSFSNLGSSFPFPWVGYIYDLQHKYYPNFFTVSDIQGRDESFKQILSNAKAVLVNGQAVKNDIEKYYQKTDKVVSLPFCPLYNSESIEINSFINKELPSKYFIVSNQFWKHKDHKTVFNALATFYKNGGDKNIHLICTGGTQDPRDPNYFSELQELIVRLNIREQIHILGYIEKEFQLNLMLNSIAVIQATLFEGGPGGGSIYEAVAYGIPSIVSNIPINKELMEENLLFFDAGNADDLALKMQQVLSYKKLPNEVILANAEINQNKLGEALYKAILMATNFKN